MVHAECYRKNYPRSQFVRDNWKDLNGRWNFIFDDSDIGEKERWYKCFPVGREITVPYAYQTKKSGINETEYHKIMWYSLNVNFGKIEKDKRQIINFEGVDSDAKVWCNGIFIGSHVGGYCRFSFDITDTLDENGNAFIVLRVEDDNTCTKPRGKQTWMNEPFGCWYVATSGIWKSVWAERVSCTHIKHIKATPNPENYHVFFEYETEKAQDYTLTTIVKIKGEKVAEQSVLLKRENGTYSVDFSTDTDSFKIHWWTPENPQLYDLEYILRDNEGNIVDKVSSYVGFRVFKTSGNKLMLNLNPIYLRLALEQCYWRESGLTAPNEDAFIKEIELAKALGFNGLRMHQKIEDERFYYYADVMGMLVFCEMPSSYEFNEVAIEKVTKEWMDVVKQNYNHPSIIVWVPVNESWGVNRLTSNKNEAHFTTALYNFTKAYDPIRPVISNDGWEHTTSDIVTFHNYCQSPKELTEFLAGIGEVLEGKNRNEYTNLREPFVNGYGYEGQPVMIDEFAGIGFKKNGDEGWGYGDKVVDESAFTERLKGLIKAVVGRHEISGFCVTQLTDTYQEINGLYDFDRELKADAEEIRRAILQK